MIARIYFKYEDMINTWSTPSVRVYADEKYVDDYK